MTHSSVNSVNGRPPLTNLTVANVDIYEYLEFVLYNKYWFNNNSGISTSEPGRFLEISHRTGRLMCNHIHTHTGKVISIYTVHWVANIELSTDEAK